MTTLFFSSQQSITLFSTLLLFLAISNIPCTIGSYSAIFSFGDSLADTGNNDYLSPPEFKLSPPYGETYFHRPAGRRSDGRLVIDFIAEHLGFPLLPPNSVGSKNTTEQDFGRQGANFAVGGATALDFQCLKRKGIDNLSTNSSLKLQLSSFNQLLSSLCSTPSDRRKLLEKSLIVLGEIGGNDYNYAFFQGISYKEIRALVPLINNVIAESIKELIALGATTILVPGNLPIGCLPIHLTSFKNSSREEDYDPFTGCINWLNDFSQYHNQKLQIQLSRIRKRHRRVKIIYADYYNAAINFYRFPTKFGFSRGEILKSCCGGGGPYNYSGSSSCGRPPLVTSCDDPSSRVSWDGVHLTEASYRWIFKAIMGLELETPFASSSSSQYITTPSSSYVN